MRCRVHTSPPCMRRACRAALLRRCGVQLAFMRRWTHPADIMPAGCGCADPSQALLALPDPACACRQSAQLLLSAAGHHSICDVQAGVPSLRRSGATSRARQQAQRPVSSAAVAAADVSPGDAASASKSFLGIEYITWKKIVPLGFMFFCILFNYTILRDTKVLPRYCAPTCIHCQVVWKVEGNAPPAVDHGSASMDSRGWKAQSQGGR